MFKTLVLKASQFVALSVALFLSTTAHSAPIVLSVGPATDNNCDYNTVFDAVNSGFFNMDIRISNELITTTGVTITDYDVINLSGGYFNCADAENGILDIFNPYSEITNLNAGPALRLSYITRNSHIIDISGLKFHDSNGGITVTSGAGNTSLTINMSSVDIYDNIFHGLKTSGTGVVINYDHGVIENNIDGDFGGGLNCTDAEIHFGEDVKINNNKANLGGGIYAKRCTVYMLAGDTGANNYGIVNNKANNAGGGAYLDESFLLGFGLLSHPISISNNAVLNDTVDGRGGGIYIESGSSMQITNARIDGNKAKLSGGAIATVHSNANISAPTFLVGRDVGGCSYAETCVSLSGNTVSNNASYGVAISQRGGGFGYVLNALIENNTSTTATSVFKVRTNAQLYLISDIVVNNQSQNHLIDQQNESFVGIQYSTLADNIVQNYFAVQYDNNNPQTLEVTATIIKNGQATIAFLDGDNGNHDAQVKCSLVEVNDTTGVVQNQSIIGEPHFIGNGNYKLLTDSIAIDSNCTTVAINDLAELDARGQSRLDDGNADLGAYEIIPLDDIIFTNSFEGGL